MSNFTKSILYSTTVLAVGLVAIFSIYDNVTTSNSAKVAAIEPAAGESDLGIAYDSDTNEIKASPAVSSDLVKKAENQMDDVPKPAKDVASAAGDTASDAAQALPDDSEKTLDETAASLDKATGNADASSEDGGQSTPSEEQSIEPAAGTAEDISADTPAEAVDQKEKDATQDSSQQE